MKNVSTYISDGKWMDEKNWWFQRPLHTNHQHIMSQTYGMKNCYQQHEFTFTKYCWWYKTFWYFKCYFYILMLFLLKCKNCFSFVFLIYMMKKSKAKKITIITVVNEEVEFDQNNFKQSYILQIMSNTPDVALKHYCK